MENYQCIAIGINRYHFLQPLNHAESDAQILYHFLVAEAKFPTQRSLLLTDTSPKSSDRSTYPNRDNLFYQLRQLARFPSASVWFFFSGYGMHYQGEDYLMPIDGNPNDILGTGISVRSLFEALPTPKIGQNLVILDINRLAMGGMKVGKGAIALAKQMKISLVLSSQPDELSYETPSLGHGVFAGALLEALRYYRQKITLAKLEQYLRDRLPEFSSNYWRPMQTPVIISPSPEASLLPLLIDKIMPSEISAGKSQTVLSPNTRHLSPRLQSITLEARASDTRGTSPVSTVTLPKLPNFPVSPSVSEISLPTNPVVREPETTSKIRHSHAVFAKIFQFKWFFSGLGCSLISSLLLTFLIYKLFQAKQPTSSPQASEVKVPAQSSSEVINRTDRELIEQAKAALVANQASDFNRAIGSLRQLKPNALSNENTQTDILRWSQTILDIAEGRAEIEDFTGAIAAADLVPSDQTMLYQTAQAQIRYWESLKKEQQANLLVIEAAKGLIRPNRAASYSRAIAFLGQIQPKRPGYLEARKFANNWSQKIYFLALSSAAREDLPKAIEIAQLIPSDSPLYEDAQNAIARWRKASGEIAK